MGGGTYATNFDAKLKSFVRSDSMKTAEYATKSLYETFSKRNIDNAMNPCGIDVRESRDSDEHPNSLAIIIALDVTGSMGSVPHFLIKEGLPDIMGRIIEAGIPDPQVLFLGIGDHLVDQAPLQVGQFESNDKLLDHWLESVYLEGGGGGNGGESYHLAWMFGAHCTSIDCMEKRDVKGIIFTIGDEPVHPMLHAADMKKIMGQDFSIPESSAAELLEAASEKYDVFHINICQTLTGSRSEVAAGWRELIGNNLLMARQREDVAKIIADTIIATAGQKVIETENGTHVFTKIDEDVADEMADLKEMKNSTQKEETML
jgi:hypothetical protein